MQEVIKKQGKIYRTNRGFFGSLTVIPTRVKGVFVDGSKTFTRPIRLPIARVGIEEGTDVAVGVMNTRVIPESAVNACVETWGENWRPEFDKLVDQKAKAMGMTVLESEKDLKIRTRLHSGPTVVAPVRCVENMKPAKPGKAD